MTDFQSMVKKADFNIKELTYAIRIISETVKDKEKLKLKKKRKTT